MKKIVLALIVALTACISASAATMITSDTNSDDPIIYIGENDTLQPIEGSPVFVDFWAPWCGPCLQYGPIFKTAAENYCDNVKFVKINVDEHPLIAALYGITGIPTTLIFLDGFDPASATEPDGEISGLVSYDYLASVIQEAIALTSVEE